MASSRVMVPSEESPALWTVHGSPPVSHRRSGMVISAGPFHIDFGETLDSMAAANVNGLKADPACRRAWVARLNLAVSKSRPPTMARISPVAGSMATRAAEGSCGSGRCAATASSAARCMELSRLVRTRRPPEKVSW